jgi:hypothetical protein
MKNSLFVPFCQSMQKGTKKIFDWLNSRRLLRRLRLNNTQPKAEFLFKPSAATFNAPKPGYFSVTRLWWYSFKL